MVALLVVVLVLVLVAVVYWAVRRRGDDEVHSVEGYRQTLDTLQDMRSRSSGTVRVLGRPDQAHAEGPGETSSAAGAPGARSRTAGGAGAGSDVGPPDAGGRDTPPGGLVFQDPPPLADDSFADRPRTGADRGGRSGAAARGPGGPTRRRPNQRAISSMNRRPRRLLAPIATAVAVLVLIGVLAYVGARSHSSNPPSAKATHATTTHATTPQTTTGHSTSTVAAPGGAGHHHSGHGKSTGANAHKKKGSSHHRTTPTTVPKVLNPVTASTTSATYTTPSSSYSLTLSVPSGDCWVSVQSGSSGPTLFSGTINAGQHQSVPASGLTLIDVGAPSVLSLAVNGVPVTLPAGAEAPFMVTLQPSTT